jgi:hypothetical protein
VSLSQRVQHEVGSVLDILVHMIGGTEHRSELRRFRPHSLLEDPRIALVETSEFIRVTPIRAKSTERTLPPAMLLCAVQGADFADA